MSTKHKIYYRAAPLSCVECDGEGAIYKSRYGGNDPDVWRTGTCRSCAGSGQQICAYDCDRPAVVINGDGEPLCEECMDTWEANT